MKRKVKPTLMLILTIFVLATSVINTSAITCEKESENIESNKISKCGGKVMAEIKVFQDEPFVEITGGNAGGNRIGDYEFKVKYNINAEGGFYDLAYAKCTVFVNGKQKKDFYKETDEETKKGTWEFSTSLKIGDTVKFILEGYDSDYNGAPGCVTKKGKTVKYYCTNDYHSSVVGKPEGYWVWRIWNEIVPTGADRPTRDTRDENSAPFKIKSEEGENLALNWQITQYPSWGDWEFYPSSGKNLLSKDGWKDINIRVRAPKNEKDVAHTYSGIIRVQNLDDPEDYYDVGVEVTVEAKSKALQKENTNPVYYQRIIEYFPCLGKILNNF